MVACSSCGAENPDGAKFCMECAAAFETPAGLREQRKTVTGGFL
jgi:hypothetical protein